MNKLTKNKWLILGLIIVLPLFYWFFGRPAHIRKVCANQANIKYNQLSDYWEKSYKACLNGKGLKD